MRTIKAVVTSVILSAFALSIYPQAAVPTPQMPAWMAPEPRTKALTLFAPKPITGDNIFKGEAEGWLADAIINLEIGRLTPIRDRAVLDYIEQLGQHLVKYSTVPNKAFHFVVIDSEEENAFNIGAGRVYIDLGMLRSVKTEDELISIIAHEIGHDAFNHAPKTVTRQMFWMTGVRKVRTAAETQTALGDLNNAYSNNDAAMVGERLLGWSRANELEADRAGFYNTFKAGYNPEAMKNVFEHFVAETKRAEGDSYNDRYFFDLMFGSHPPSSQRVTALKWESNWIKMPAKGSMHKSAAFDAMKMRIKAL